MRDDAGEHVLAFVVEPIVQHRHELDQAGGDGGQRSDRQNPRQHRDSVGQQSRQVRQRRLSIGDQSRDRDEKTRQAEEHQDEDQLRRQQIPPGDWPCEPILAVAGDRFLVDYRRDQVPRRQK